jgi:hypothetical protein
VRALEEYNDFLGNELCRFHMIRNRHFK